MSFIKIYIHLVWSTKNRQPFLGDKSIRKKVWQHIKHNSLSQDIFIDSVNGLNDHCHCLISLGADQTIKKVVQMIKGESSFWINNQVDFISSLYGKFQWQDDYFAISVSESMVDVVRTYIHNQEEHHSRKTFAQEYDELIAKFGFTRKS